MNPFAAWIGERPAFVVWRAFDKSPVDPLHADPQSDYARSNAQDPTTWLPWRLACEYARALGAGYGVGIVIAEPLLCVDVDHCIADDTLSPFATLLVTDARRECPDVYVEVSMSGRGVHIIGPYLGSPPIHSTKNHEHHAELYTARRYIALTGRMIGERGPAGGHLTNFLLALTWSYFRPSGVLESSASWTSEDDPACPFEGNAAARIEILLHSTSIAAKFSPAKVTFADLHCDNVDKLAAAWPAPGAGEAYDESSADQAYFNHLAYGFANNAEAILDYALSEACPRQRDKWHARPDYMRSTILKAIALPKKWPKKPRAPTLGSVPPPPPPAPAAPPPPSDTALPAPPAPVEMIPSFVGASHMPALFEGYVYVNDMHRIVGPDGFIMDKPKFDAHPRFAKRTYMMDAAGGKTSSSAWDAFIQSEVSGGVKVRGAIFDPLQPPGAVVIDEGIECLNTWRPVVILAEPGDVTPFLEHLQRLFVDWRLLLEYLKFMVQRQGEKIMWWPFLQGCPGNGKSFISDTMEYCIGTAHTRRPTPKNMDSNFNSTLYGSLFLAIEDIKVAEDYASFWETVKPMVTQRRLEIEYKGVDKLTRPVCFNAIMNSNHKTGIRKETDDRRIAPFFARQQQKSDLDRDGLTEPYFVALWNWAKTKGWPRILHFLRTTPIDESFSPVKCPVTSSTEEHIRVSRPPVEQEVLEAVRCRVIGFRDGWINLLRLTNLLESKRYRTSVAGRHAMLESLGYMRHPRLPDGQVLTPLPDTTTPTLYVTVGHASLRLSDPAAIKASYESANR